MEKVIDKKVWSTQDIIKTPIVTAMIVFTATMIWSRFLFIESTVETNQQRNDKRYVRASEDRANI